MISAVTTQYRPHLALRLKTQQLWLHSIGLTWPWDWKHTLGLRTCYIALLTWVDSNSSALQSRKWQLIGMSWWYRGALCGHLLPAMANNWIRGAAHRHTTAPISALGLHPIARELLLISRPTQGRRLSWPEHTVGKQPAQGCLQMAWVRFALATWKLRVRYSPTRPPAPTKAHGCEQLAQSCYPAMWITGVELTTSRSQVWHPNHYTTEPQWC